MALKQGNDITVNAILHPQNARREQPQEKEPEPATPAAPDKPKKESPRKLPDGVRVNILIRKRTLAALKEKAKEMNQTLPADEQTSYNKLVRNLLEEFTGTAENPQK